MAQLYSDNLGNAIGTGLAQGTNNFLQRSDQLDEKNYQRGLTDKSDQKQHAADAYNYLSDLDKNFTAMQQQGGQDQTDPLAIAQTKEAQKTVQALRRRLAQGDYSALDDLPKFQQQMDSITGATSKGNDRLGALAYRGTAAQTTVAENQATLTTADANEANTRAALVTRGLTASTTLQEVQARIASATEGLTSASQIAQMLGTIADEGGLGAQAAQEYLKTADPKVQAAFATRSQQADSVRATTVAQASVSLGMSQQQLGQITEQRPELLKGLQWQTALQGQNYWQADKMNKINLAQAGTDLEAAQFRLANDKDLAPDQKALLHTQLGINQSQLAIAQATQNGTIKGTNSQNYAVLAENGDTEEFAAMVKDGTMTQAEADLWISLSNQKKEMRDLQLSKAKSDARQGVVAANVAEQTQQDAVKGIHFDTMTKGYQSVIGKYTALYAPQTTKAEASSATSAATTAAAGAAVAPRLAQAQVKTAESDATTAAANASVAAPLAQAGLQTAQAGATTATAQANVADGMARAGLRMADAQANSATYQAAFDGATLQDKIAGSGVQLATQRANLTTALADSQVASGTVGLRIKAMGLSNDMTVAQLSTARQQLMDMKQAYQQKKLTNPKDIQAMDAALALVQAQTLAQAGKTGASKDNQLAALTQLGIQYRNDRGTHLRQFQQLFKTYATSAKIAVDQFDPSNWTRISATLPDGDQKKELDALVTTLAKDDKNNADVGEAIKTLSGAGEAGTGGDSGGATVSGTGSNRTMTAAPGFKAKSDSVAAKVGVNPAGLYAFLGAESNFGSNTANYKGMDYVGVGQIGQAAQDDVNRTMGTKLDRFDPDQNMELAARYYKILAGRLGTQDPATIYAAYNWGIGNVQKHLAANGGRLVMSTLPSETQTGLGNVAASYRGYGNDKGKTLTTTTAPPVPVSPVGKGNYRSSGGGVYSSPTILPKQWQTLDKNGFFKAAGTIKTDADGVAFVKKYGSLLYGPKPTQDQLDELWKIAGQVK